MTLESHLESVSTTLQQVAALEIVLCYINKYKCILLEAKHLIFIQEIPKGTKGQLATSGITNLSHFKGMHGFSNMRLMTVNGERTEHMKRVTTCQQYQNTTDVLHLHVLSPSSVLVVKKRCK